MKPLMCDLFSLTNTRNRDAIKMNMDSLSTVTHVSYVTCISTAGQLAISLNTVLTFL